MSFSVVTKNAEDFGLSLPQSASLTAPSSEGAFGRKTIIYPHIMAPRCCGDIKTGLGNAYSTVTILWVMP